MLRGRELATVRPDGPTRRRELTDDEVPGVLRETFGVVLEPDDLARLRLGT